MGGTVVYDSVRNITWLANANANGLMNWTAANTWANGLTVGGFTGWRLPTTLQPDATCSDSIDAGSPYGAQSYGVSCTGSELGNLFYNGLGGVANQSITTTHNANYDLFTNIQSSVYWSGTEYAPIPDNAWYFGTDDGYQDYGLKDNSSYAWAVRSGDVAAVPEPGVMGLLGIGALAWAGTKARRRG